MKRVLVRSVVVAFLVGFVTFTAIVSIGPLSRWSQETGACWGADRIERDVRDGGEVRSRGGSTTGTTVFELRCTYAEDDVRLVGNDEATLKGFAVAFLVGFIPAFLVRAGLLAYRQRAPRDHATAG